MLRPTLIVLLASLLVYSCKSVDSFSKRKYLSGARHSSLNLNHEAIPANDVTSPAPTSSISETTHSVAEGTTQETETLPVSGLSSTPEEFIPALPAQELTAQPQDTITKTKKEIRKEKLRSDKARALRSLIGGYYALGSAILFFLAGLWFGTNGPNFFMTDFVTFIFFILFIIPIYFALLAESVVLSALSLIWAHLVRSKHKGEKEFTGNTETRTGVILSLIAILVATLGVIFGLPNFLSW